MHVDDMVFFINKKSKISCIFSQTVMMILYLLDKSIMIAQLLKHELSNKTRKFTLDTGEELEASLESTEQGVAIFASKKVDEITQV